MTTDALLNVVSFQGSQKMEKAGVEKALEGTIRL